MNIDIFNNIIALTDSYKCSHWKQYPAGTRHVFSFFESRGGEFPETMFFGLQYWLKAYLQGQVVTADKIGEAEEIVGAHIGPGVFNRAGWERILRVHDGRLPIEIRAVAEGSMIPTRNALMTAVNTDPELPWLTNYLETLLSQVWYPCTVGTRSRSMRRAILRNLQKTGTPALIDFKLHDFGFRGSTSVESSGIGGAAHLVNFQGTDTMSALMLLRRVYGAKMAGFSIPAAEHSTITSWGRPNEVEAFRNMLTQFPTGLVAVVSDSFDIYRACEELWGTQLREQVLARDGTLVVRPDSGDPLVVVPRVLEILGRKFGFTTNDKGYKVLDPHVRVIQGDGIDPVMLERILDTMVAAGWSGDNIAFGSGGGLLQKDTTRDTSKYAFKCSSVLVEGESDWRDVLKDPVTDPGKKSKAGRLLLINDGTGYRTVAQDDAHPLPEGSNLLVPVFRDGNLLVDHTLDAIRARAAA